MTEKKVTITEKELAKDCAEKLQALAEPNRIRIIECLRDGEKSVTALANMLGVEIVNVSHHLGVLRQAKLVRDEKKGRFVYYSLNQAIFTNNGSDSTSMDLGWCKIEIPHRC